MRRDREITGVVEGRSNSTAQRGLLTVSAPVQAALADLGLQPAEGDTAAARPRLPQRQRRNLQLRRAAAVLPLRVHRSRLAGAHVRPDPTPAQTCRDRPRQELQSLVRQPLAPSGGLGSCAVCLGEGRRSARGGLAGSLGLQRRGELPGYCNRRVTRLLSKAATELSSSERELLLDRADALIARDLPTLPLFDKPGYLIYDGRIRNVTWNPIDVLWNAQDWWIARP